MFSLLWLISLKEGRLICGSWYQRFLSKFRWPCQTGLGWGRLLRQGGCGGVKPSGTKERRRRTQTPASEAVSVFVQVTPPPTFYHVVKLFDPSCKWGRLRRNKQQPGIKPRAEQIAASMIQWVSKGLSAHCLKDCLQCLNHVEDTSYLNHNNNPICPPTLISKALMNDIG